VVAFGGKKRTILKQIALCVMVRSCRSLSIRNFGRLSGAPGNSE
jgi:hypothetical protein